ncbi:lipoxygenase [Shewanella sp. Scap07]|uniref:lipoxygenase family protein n=1 Tax=Shewanella sp. Scap07 TaxID=2589987 RepID=UPI0015B8BD2E|nr:lipoxygenase family protein [Shewanella sp. Scap07]QLE83995.1 lipoxygenase [Shewanella sp. Scap07]
MFNITFGHNDHPRTSPSLPQHDSPSEQEAREIQLAEAKTTYIWDTDVASVKGVPMAESVPEADKPTIAWFIKVIEVALQVVENTLANSIEDDDSDDLSTLGHIRDNLNGVRQKYQDQQQPSAASWLTNVLVEARHLLNLNFSNVSAELKTLQLIVERHQDKISNSADNTLAAYKELFNTIALSDVAEQFQSDAMFAYYRVAGPNPMLITCISEVPAKFPVTDDGYQRYMGDSDSIAKALSEQRLFLLDYHELQLLVDNPGFYDGLAKQLFAPLVLLARPINSDALVPVAIQRSQDPQQSEIVYATENPQDEQYWPWQTAKSIVEMSEGNYHELFVHLARTHLLIEPFAIATQRNLAKSHPLNVLLTPHFEGTLFINNSATGSLIAEGGPIDQIFAAEITYSQQAAGNDRLAYDFYANMLPNDLARRGVADANILPNYPYRDDALLIWEAINQWLNQYVNIYYQHDSDVIGDTELAAWTADVIEQGKVAGFTTIENKAQLVEVLTMVVFTASAQHAAVNFPQSSIMTYAPAISGSIWGDKDPQGANEQQWLATMSPLSLASKQLNFLHLLGGVYYRMLGHYQTNDFPYLDWFEDPKVSGEDGALSRFQQHLQEIEQQINQRNSQQRDIPYTHLLPSRIPMSINI